ncbi:alpha/beta hydrolase [Bacillus swezeyi]|uniref:Alpha/beta hydrolase n=1 Tax=Bacillus swezeyi TaxID=1925020 RepID=A0A1R1QLN2_9BACI|nr:alpha/beta hydrolase [Bacillus swezeyi]MEC1262769.1 alpha/beta hydrolase [Bacillus swezeyi]MED2928612.1 alpha/beta hydrolase [Bacillus swezeyi]MED2945238.1 alpha/beta hydrolase [Bacillus swezeyi]MED2962941.1 alpha/beta hydrolase [Bacillus swezeyi]MED3074569.1 alpha/beta hydrolase [Bacillus swezeyi]
MWIGILLIILGLGLSIFAVSLIVSYLFVLPNRSSYEETFFSGVKNGEIIDDVFDSSQKEELFLTSEDGCRLHAMLFPVPESRKAVMIAHGIKWSLFGGYKYVELFQSLGYHVLLCDSRCHGLSGGSHVSYGFYEKNDLAMWADELENKLGKDLWIGVHGESLGAAAAIELMKQDRRIQFCIADSCFSDLTELCRFQLKAAVKLAVPFLIPLTSSLIKRRHGWGLADISPVSDLEQTDTPLFIIHGTDDQLVPSQMAKNLYERKKGIKRLYLIEGAGHVGGFRQNPEEYFKKIKDFLLKVEPAN